MVALSVAFFFQAEAGIRYGHVTGVQTCALPIWIQMAPRNRPDRIRHREHGKSECEGHAEQADADVWKCGRKNGTAATAQHQPECADELGERTLRQRHRNLPLVDEACDATSTAPETIDRELAQQVRNH